MSRPATQRLKVNAPVGDPPLLEFLRCDDLEIDESYQRSLQCEASQTLIRQIAMFWEWPLCQPLVVARRGGRFFVVDGQHRLKAAELRGDIVELPCVIGDYVTASDEAAAFVALNSNRRRLTAIDLFRAALAAGDPVARHIDQIMTEAGLRLAKHQNYISWRPGDVSNIGGIRRAFSARGATVTRLALEALAKGFPDVVLRYSGTLFPGMVRVIVEAGSGYNHTKFIVALRGRTQKQWMQRSLEVAARGDPGKRDTAVFNALFEGYQATLQSGLHQPPAPAPAPAPSPPIIAESERAWCYQCERNCAGSEVARCTDRFCALRR